MRDIEELLIKVPAPYYGVEDVGFSLRQPAQRADEPLRDVTVFVEGTAAPMRRLVERLRLLPEKDHLVEPGEEDGLYAWTSPIQLTDEVCVIGFHDRSVTAGLAPPGPTLLRGYVWNLVRPLAFTFLRDCVRLAGLRLSEHITLVLDSGGPAPFDMEIERSAIVPSNGDLLLYA